jgi:glutamate-1-semialdehyde 2,1-aminomutase
MARDRKGIDRARLKSLYRREADRFAARTPKSRELYRRGRESMPHGVPQAWMAGFYPETPIYVRDGAGACFVDVDGNSYLDMSQCDLSMSCGYGPPAVAEAVARQFRAGSHFLLPTEDALAVSGHLARRFGVPFWQFTLSASGANTEAIRLARLATGRDRVLVFAGKYHGHIDDTLVEPAAGGLAAESLGLSRSVVDRAIVIPFNDPAALDDALSQGDIACVLAEPVMTNIGVILPDDGYHAALRGLTRRHGTLLIIDETHTQMAVFGGFTRLWNLEPDILTTGKSLGGGIPIGAYGMSAPLARLMEDHLELQMEGEPGLAVGGTTYGNALGLAASRAALEQVLTPAGYERIAGLGRRLADGIDALIARRNLPWRAYRLGNRSGICLNPVWPRNAAEFQAIADLELSHATRVFMANRGIWEPIVIHGPSLSFAHEAADVDRYLSALEELVDAVT